MHEEIMLWEYRLRHHRNQKRKLSALKDTAKQQESLIKSLESRLDKGQLKVKACTSRLEEATNSIAQLEKEKEELLEKQNDFKKMLEVQKNISKTKLRAVETKYATIKSINIGLEVHIIKIQAEMEKYKQLLLESSKNKNQENSKEIT